MIARDDLLHSWPGQLALAALLGLGLSLALACLARDWLSGHPTLAALDLLALVLLVKVTHECRPLDEDEG